MAKLTILGIFNLGEKNERVIFKAVEACDAHNYIVMDNTYDQDGDLSNLSRHVFRFPQIELNPGDQLRLYTGKGTNNVQPSNDKTFIIHNIYWNLKEHVWNQDGDTIYLYYIALKDRKTINK